jgi:2-oxoglutarate ferredoxin oxidoreductase subunit delta
MAGKIKIDRERCKGCGLCVAVCDRGGVVISRRSNKNGFFPAEAFDSECTGCAKCALICPEAVIEVYREERVVEIRAAGGKKSELIKEKTG